MSKTSLNIFNKGANASKALVLNFEFWSFEFVSNFGFKVLKSCHFLARFNELIISDTLTYPHNKCRALAAGQPFGKVPVQ
jgi:hypothetical protein